ncbi:MAG: GNAT family N-acetyltransferase [Thermoplasmatota archaeon]
MRAAVIRLAEARDLPEINALEHLSFPEQSRFPEMLYRDLVAAREWAVCLVVEDGGAVIAFAAAFETGRARTANVATLQTHPDARRRGHARALLAELIARLAARGVRRVTLEVGVENAGAIALYERALFRRVRRLPNYYPGERQPDAWEYELRLTRGREH